MTIEEIKQAIGKVSDLADYIQGEDFEGNEEELANSVFSALDDALAYLEDLFGDQ